jgi:Pyruvate/2-oxoacid:ferredoxin oxidoreductase gamma subunit
MVMLGAVLARDHTLSIEAVRAALPKVLHSKTELAELDLRAIDAGYEACSEAAHGA